jgi:glycosyltransferase involved in cell wall biosynthesis
LLNLPNEEEKRTLEQLSIAAPAIVLPYGLNEIERAALAGAAQSARDRLARKEICFLGMWSVRKGSRDWPEIVRAILSAEPSARFAILGTMTDDATVFRDLQLSSREGVRCVAQYDPRELAKLIAGCTVGLFPSYIEGFGISVIEQLAAGIPTICYDVPGPRHIFGGNAQFLVPAGNAKALAERALQVLRMNENDYNSLSADCRRIAERFRWERIAGDTIREYETALERQRSINRARAAQTVSA